MSQLRTTMADHDRGPEYALVQCIGDAFTCEKTKKVDNRKHLTDEQITVQLEGRGWSVSPTLCPDHNIYASKSLHLDDAGAIPRTIHNEPECDHQFGFCSGQCVERSGVAT